MAKKAAKQSAQPAQKSKAGGVMMFAAMCALIPFSIPTMLLMFAGMLPTLISALTDRSLSRYAWICVGGLNFAGLAPALLKLWFGHHEITFALRQVMDLRVLFSAYGAALAGWVLYFGAPPVVITVMVATTKRRASTMVALMKRLEEEWGEEVASRGMLDEDDLL